MKDQGKTTNRRRGRPRKSEAGRKAEADLPRERQIAEAAYYLAEKRGFEPGHELDDWLEAEKIIRADEH